MRAARILFAGSLRAGKRAAVVMSLIQSAKLNGHDPYRSISKTSTSVATRYLGREMEQSIPNYESE